MSREYHEILDEMYPNLFDFITDHKNELCIYFKDKSISDLKLILDKNLIRPQIISLHTDDIRIGIMSCTIDLALHVSIQQGYFTMNRNLFLSDAACVKLYDQNITIEYVDNGGYFDYDQELITRRHTINTIIG